MTSDDEGKPLTTTRQLEIVRLLSAEADDIQLTSAVADLINDAYAAAESGLWADSTRRTTAEEIAWLIRNRQVAVARVGGRIVGCVRVQLGSGIGEFGMLAVRPGSRGMGVGRALVQFAEQAARNKRCDTMQIEVLVPCDRSSAYKKFLTGWYIHLGYKRVRTASVEEHYPGLSLLLATPCYFGIYHKTLHE